MNSPNMFDVKNNSDYTKQICYCTFFSIMLIIIFTLTPLNKITLLSSFAKIITLIILSYAIYLNYKQTSMLKGGYKPNDGEFSKQLSTNITTSYVFIIFLAILFIFIVKSLVI